MNDKPEVQRARTWLDAQLVRDRSDDKTFYQISADNLAGLLAEYAAHAPAPPPSAAPPQLDLKVCREVLQDAQNSEYGACVGIFLNRWAPKLLAQAESAPASHPEKCPDCGSDKRDVRLTASFDRCGQWMCDHSWHRR